MKMPVGMRGQRKRFAQKQGTARTAEAQLSGRPDQPQQHLIPRIMACGTGHIKVPSPQSIDHHHQVPPLGAAQVILRAEGSPGYMDGNQFHLRSEPLQEGSRMGLGQKGHLKAAGHRGKKGHGKGKVSQRPEFGNQQTRPMWGVTAHGDCLSQDTRRSSFLRARRCRKDAMDQCGTAISSRVSVSATSVSSCTSSSFLFRPSPPFMATASPPSPANTWRSWLKDP